MVPPDPDQTRVRSIYESWPGDLDVDVAGHGTGVLGPQHFLRSVDHALDRPRPDRAGEAFLILAVARGIASRARAQGGQGGEHLLRVTAAAVTAAAPVVALVGHYNGAAFTVFCPHGGPAVADFLAEGIRTAVRDGEAGRGGVTMQFGISQACAGMDAGALVDAATADLGGFP